ncbi:MAG: isoleucine--tRNA ligase [Bdellovibrionales bacterium]|nr:isoleucine--tRNA ligase [Bdellovibrionales bacterium]
MQVQLPKTDFPMKGNLSQNEPARIAAWSKDGLYQKILNRPAPKGTFVLPDGPPYANGNIHVGHALNKILKDIVIKYKNLAGYKAAFIPGWDCHGLPIELNVTKKLGPKRKEMNDAQIRQLCREEATSWVEKQKEQFIRLGVLADWQNPWMTLQPTYEADEIRVLAKIFENGIFYRGEKPVYWDPALQTALAAAEVEYKNHKSLSIFVKFPYEGTFAGLPKKPISFLIWTTTPWTLPANYGIALNADFSYGFFDTGSDILILAEDLKESVEKETGLTLTLLASKKGAEFDRLKAKHPFLPRESLVVLGDHVTLEAGSGAVHTAPGHGLEDYVVGLKYGLPVHSPVDEAGRFRAEIPQWAGEKIADANPKIVEHLRSLGLLVAVKEIEHSYPHSPRSKAPLIFRATPQWFIRMDDEAFPLRKKCLTAAEKDIAYFPKWGIQRLTSMLANSPDWCVSRQRIWGVPIPVFYCDKCKTPLVNAEVMNRLADVMEKTKEGIEAYFSHPTAEFTHGHTCGECKYDKFSIGKDILDVWFDSGVCHTAVQKRLPNMQFPADVYLEGSDQHRGWFQTSLVSSIAAYDKPPFKALITHGFVNDAQGYKMSKSVGNTVDPMEIIKESGAEILRLWVSHEDYGQDLTISKEMIARISDTYRRFRNTIRFLLGNLYDFDPAKDQLPYQEMTPLDRWALHQLNELTEKCTAAYDAFEFYKVYHGLNNFFAHDLSATYLDILKDRLYTGKVDGLKRRAAQTVLYQALNTLCGLMAPIASFLAEETYGYLPGEKKESVFLTDFPQARAEWKAPQVAADFAVLLEVRAAAQKEMEELRRQKVIGSSLDAQIKILAPDGIRKVLEAYRPSLREFFMVSQFEISPGLELKVEPAKAEGIKCERCWHYDMNTGKDARFAGVCPKCVEALS